MVALKNDPDECVGFFLQRTPVISQLHIRGGTGGKYCHFPDMESYFEEDHFEGVEFACGYPPEEEDIIIVSEDVFFNYIRLACEKYIQLHPEDSEKINELLAQIP